MIVNISAHLIDERIWLSAEILFMCVRVCCVRILLVFEAALCSTDTDGRCLQSHAQMRNRREYDHLIDLSCNYVSWTNTIEAFGGMTHVLTRFTTFYTWCLRIQFRKWHVLRGQFSTFVLRLHCSIPAEGEIWAYCFQKMESTKCRINYLSSVVWQNSGSTVNSRYLKKHDRKVCSRILIHHVDWLIPCQIGRVLQLIPRFKFVALRRTILKPKIER